MAVSVTGDETPLSRCIHTTVDVAVEHQQCGECTADVHERIRSLAASRTSVSMCPANPSGDGLVLASPRVGSSGLEHSGADMALHPENLVCGAMCTVRVVHMIS